MKLKEILGGVDTREIHGDTEKEISGISLDSRKIKQNHLFAAIPGERSDGHIYIDNALENGASAVLVSNLPRNIDDRITYIVVRDTSVAVAAIAANFCGNPSDSLHLTGITGTNGKTTLTYLLESIWKMQKKIPGIIGTIETRYGNSSKKASLTTPDPVELSMMLREMRQQGVENVAMEVSSHAIDRKRVYGCNFDCAVFTNLSRDHLDYHKSFDNYFGAKKKLFTEILKNSNKKRKFAILNIDDRFGRDISNCISQTMITYSLQDPRADVYASDFKLTENGISSAVSTPWGNLDLHSSLIGRHNLYNLLAAVSSALPFCDDPSLVEEGISGNIVIPGRLEKIENKTGINVLVDYAHTPHALENILLTVRAITGGRLIVVFGCGGDRDRSKRPEMGHIAYSLSDLAIITSDNPRNESPESIISDIKNGIDPEQSKPYMEFVNREDAIREAIQAALPGDFVIIAGKGHEDYQIVGNEILDFDDRLIARKYLEFMERKMS